MKCIWILSGGTGGHISPARSITEALIEKRYKVVFITLFRNKKYPDIIYLSNKKGVETAFYHASRLPKDPFSFFSFLISFLQCFKILNQLRTIHPPEVVLGMGGYPSFPGLVWARFKKIPYYLCEQNAVFGVITKLMSKKAAKIFLSFPKKNYKRNEVLTGNPIRDIFLSFKGYSISPRWPAKKILIVGGSQGAHDLNELYKEFIQDRFFQGRRIFLIAGKKKDSNLKKIRRKQDVIYDFVLDMPRLLNSVDLVISRAGSGLLFEILYSKRPSILLPFPYAKKNHQKANAKSLSKLDLAKVVDIRPFNAKSVSKKIKEILSKEEFKDVSKNVKRHFLPLDAHKRIVDQLTRDLYL